MMILGNNPIFYLLMGLFFTLSVATDRTLFNETTETTPEGSGVQVDTDPCRQYDSDPDACKKYVDPDTGETCQSCQEWLSGGTDYKGTVCFNEDRPVRGAIYLGCY